MEATQVKPETTVAPPEGPGKKSPQLTPPKKKRKWVKRLVILLVIAALLVLALSVLLGMDRFTRLKITGLVLGMAGAVAVVLAGAVCLWLAARAIPAYVPETTTAAQAVATCPDCLITTGEYELIRELLEQEEITAHFADGATFSFDMSFSSQYQDRVQVNGQHPGYFTISILGWNLYVDYGTCMDGRVLQVYTPDGTVIKHVYAYPSPPETVAGTGPDGETVTLTRPRDFSYFISNTDNAQFTQTVSRRVDPVSLSGG